MVDVLFICTGNLCRSPSAAWFFRQQLDKHGPAGVTVESAGIRGSSSDPPSRLAKEGAAFGLNLKGHESTKVDAESIARADLIVGMAREHVREIVLADTPAFAKTFTLREIVRRGKEHGARQPDESLSDWLLRIGAGRRHLELIGDSAEDDTPDPMGGFSEDFRNMLMELDVLTQALYTLIWP